MRRLTQSLTKRTGAALIAVVAAGALGSGEPAFAQSIESLRVPEKPLVLKSRGSFYVGGEQEEQSAADLGGGGPVPDSVTVNQMYVEYMVPNGRLKSPLVLIHGAGLSGKTYDTTPDGRMGWFEYFVRKSHPTYVVDQVGRARSGFNQAVLNRRLAGTGPQEESRGAFRFGTRVGVWTNFRFGPRYGETFPDSQFPTEAAGELAKQGVPDMRAFIPSPNPTFKALAQLATSLKGAVIVSHSQSGNYPMQAALLDPAGIRGIVAVEPGNCGNDIFSDEQITRLAKVPTLILFGDYLPVPTGFGPNTWQNRFDACEAYVKRIKAAGGRADLIGTASQGIKGNSHMLMQDRNSDQIADFILKWVYANATGR